MGVRVLIAGAFAASVVACGEMPRATENELMCGYFIDRIIEQATADLQGVSPSQCALDESAFNTLREAALETWRPIHQVRIERINSVAESFASDRYPAAPAYRGPLPILPFSDEADLLPETFKVRGRFWLSEGDAENPRPQITIYDNANPIIAMAYLDELPRSSWYPLVSSCLEICSGTVTMQLREDLVHPIFVDADLPAFKSYVAVDLKLDIVSHELLQAQWLTRYGWSELPTQAAD